MNAVVNGVAVAALALLMGCRFSFACIFIKNPETSAKHACMRSLKSKSLYIAAFAYAVLISSCAALGVESLLIGMLDAMFTMILLTVVDLKYRRVPDLITLPFAAAQLLFYVFTTPRFAELLANGIVGVFALILLVLLSVLSKGRMGLGDAKAIAVLILAFGPGTAVYILFLSVSVAFVVGITMIIARKGNLKTELPFIPFMTLGVFVCALSAVVKL
jgi:prepilin signal peptidase PulO-like enzyme (type II secretory pathway)